MGAPAQAHLYTDCGAPQYTPVTDGVAHRIPPWPGHRSRRTTAVGSTAGDTALRKEPRRQCVDSSHRVAWL
jgi:hypothetical protein